MNKKVSAPLVIILFLCSICGFCGILGSMTSGSTTPDRSSPPINKTQEVKSVATEIPAKKCEVKETSRECVECNVASVTRSNSDCTVTKEKVSDTSCSSLCPTPTPVKTSTPIYYYEPEDSRGCCKYCSKGKACGDSCINENYTCHKDPGCACDI